MSCACIKDSKFSFTIDINKEDLKFTDRSEWLGTIKESDEYTLKVYNGDSFKEFKVKPKGSILIDYNQLPIHCKFPCNFDGVYKFEITACQNSQVLSKTEAILWSVYEIYYDLLKQDKWSDAQQVLKEIETIKAYAREGDEEKAQEYYNLLMRIIKKLNCKCDATKYLQM